jgi:Family of unknown function (DUF6011)
MAYKSTNPTDIKNLLALEAIVGTMSKPDFALSLLEQARSKCLSAKQMFWVCKLADEATAARIAPPAQKADLSPIVSMFQTVGSVRARIRYQTEDGMAFQMKMVGDMSRAPGTVVVLKDKTFLGRISLQGAFTASNSVVGTVSTSIALALEAFAADPHAKAAAYGHRTGACCFCSKDLDHPVSVALGYGPVCAKRWGLAHSKEAAMKVAA